LPDNQQLNFIMDALTFIVELSKALAWPLASTGIALLFRSELRTLLGKIKKGKVGPAEFEFEQTVKVLTEEISARSQGPMEKIEDSAAYLASKDPRSAILNAWLDVQNEMRRIVAEKGLERSDLPFNSVSLRVLHRELQKQPEYINVYNELRSLRNQAVEEIDFHPRTESVLNYLKLAKELVSVLRNIAKDN
jgi:hypothetical protein